MERVCMLVLILSLFCSFHFLTVGSVEDEAKRSLISFLCSLSTCSTTNSVLDPRFNWTIDSDPCKDKWSRVGCNKKESSVTSLYLDQLNLSGPLKLDPLCKVPAVADSLSKLVLDGNSISGEVPPAISSCRQLTQFQVSRNHLSGKLPDSLSALNNLKKLDISFNNFSGHLPNMGRISGLKLFDAQNNSLTGKIPEFVFSNLNYFNVSYNNLSGPIPRSARDFSVDSFMGNPFLCGAPLTSKCPKSKGQSTKDILMYLGYALLGLVLLSVIVYKIYQRKKNAGKRDEAVTANDKVVALDDNGDKLNQESGEISKTGNSIVSGPVSTSLVVLTSPTANGLRFEDLLRAPAELLGRGKHGGLYKVICENGTTFAVKRIKGWAISSDEFKKRMQRIDEAKHPNVLPVIAFYSSKQEKLLVYEYQQTGSLFRLLHGIQMGQTFEWTMRLNVAVGIANALAAMHQHHRESNIAHGNLKSSNILFNKNMEPIISEYGLMSQDGDTSSDDSSSQAITATFEADIYGLGVILLELLTGKLVQNNGFNLAKWVHSVLREEWTVEVFDKSLISEEASEERMVDLLQVAVKCVNPEPASRPNANQIATMINAIKDNEDRSLAFEP
ncbi:probably inactive leucine-rich repeat receptor-like protein kinase IMK2 [Punica granatum]|uniref:Protein kinase domain-containing protein n=2 Tax=Punica granatum TaxID=22663 RepID=A0A218WF29_PUNGR|nr:probably inactive leucine-rich repeat receptor-like protein kinase IMK2 [Punica granatum]OWM70672.1 hypothetical protein CDL15_Pgr014345 [Punica granatum]PKI55228.1 hypothetical protein CRG98_024519 [Punica granatum]